MKKLLFIVLLTLPLSNFGKDNVGVFIDRVIGSSLILTGLILGDQAYTEYKKIPNERMKQVLSCEKNATENNVITLHADSVVNTIKKYGWVYAKGVPALMLIAVGYAIAR